MPRRVRHPSSGSNDLASPDDGWTFVLALAVLLAGVLVFFARVLFTHRYLIPWDFRGFHLPLAMAVFDALKGTGSILWDASTYCGRPLFADPQAQVFYPPTLAAVFISTFFGSSSVAYVLEWEMVLHIFAAGAFTYMLLRLMGVSTSSALCGGLIFELGGFFASQTQHFDTVDGTIWMPLMWTAAWKVCRGFTGKWFCVLGLAGACPFSLVSRKCGVPPLHQPPFMRDFSRPLVKHNGVEP